MTSLSKPVFSNSKLGLALIAATMISMATLYAPLVNAAPIYKVIDEKTGQVTFTDRPQNYEQQAGKKISQTGVTTKESRVSSSNSDNTSSPPSSSNVNTTTQNTAAKNSPDANYQLAITEPSAERAYRRPAQSIDIKVQVKPELQAGDSVSIYLDGNEVAQGLSASIATVDVLPGSHKIKAVLKNEKGQTLKQVERTVYVIQNNTTLQNNKKIAQQLLAYQNLPWYQKVLLKMRQEGKKPNMQSFTKPIVDKPMTLEQPVIN
ncbi:MULTISPECIES: DUF4124 domain-containing protein [unclassified Psychrobacter]|uniref:DUF4124 domain-containing protein n=1 Tax=unclassified Psychrobacter TaxID=196806 RepID=UPI001918F5A1|nr:MULTISPECIES: DUF4124 domain-containing protein [unclassified Psychrobacter]